MSTDEFDAYADYEPDMREAFYLEFSRECLSSFFLEHPVLCTPAVGALARARRYRESDPSVAVVFAAAAMESCFKQAILRPLVYGFVHEPDVAAVIAAEIVKPTGLDRFKDLLKDSLESAARIDLNAHRRPGATDSLWAEMSAVWRRRNEVAHGCVEATGDDAVRAIEVAAELVEKLFPSVMARLGLRVDANMRVLGLGAGTSASP